MRTIGWTLVAVTSLSSCRADTAKIDDSLRNDLSLAAQPYAPQQFMSPLEAGYAQGYAPNGYYPQPQYARQPYGYQQAVTRSAPRIRRASGASAGSSVGRVVQKNTKRDAAIGAIAGAAIGAVTSGRKDRLKGAVLGAAVGTLLGGVIGNNVDIKR